MGQSIINGVFHWEYRIYHIVDNWWLSSHVWHLLLPSISVPLEIPSSATTTMAVWHSWLWHRHVGVTRNDPCTDSPVETMCSIYTLIIVWPCHMSFNLFQLEMFGNQDYDWGVKTGIIDRPSIRMRGQLCDGRIGRTAVIEQGHHRKKTAAVEMERIEANLRVPWLSKSTAKDTTTLARPHWNHGSKQSFKGATVLGSSKKYWQICDMCFPWYISMYLKHS